MYMLVFVSLIVAIIGTYTQAITLQTTRIYSQQSGIAQTMIAWHNNALGLATNLVNANFVASSCSLTNNLTGQIGAGTPPPNCSSNNNAYSGIVNVGLTNYPNSLSPCSGTVGAPCFVSLPNGFQSATYQFYSVIFQNASVPPQNFVLTFVPPPPQGGDYPLMGILCLPGYETGVACPGTQKQLSLTLADLYKQLVKSGLPLQNFGSVPKPPAAANQLVTPPSLQTINGVTVTQSTSYPLPVSIQSIVPPGSIGIITSFPTCGSC